MVAGGHSSNTHDHLPWPEVTSINAIPTPYQIFNQRKGAPYSKQRFLELVKMYHPDRHNSEGAATGISFETKVERYRLVVAANNILSDPVKRVAYDSCGAGWNGNPEVRPSFRDGDRAGWEGRGSPFHNATWEDWEKWNKNGNTEGEKKQQPTYVSNGAFVGLIMVFAALGSVGQVNRANKAGISFVEQRDLLHNGLSKDLMRRRKDTRDHLGDRDERVDTFLRQRDPFGYGVTDPVEEGYRKLLPEPEVCSSGDIQGRSTAVYNTEEGRNGSSAA
jgi:hypothetical protein